LFEGITGEGVMCNHLCSADEVHLTAEDFRQMNETIRKIDCGLEEWRWYLYRNVVGLP